MSPTNSVGRLYKGPTLKSRGLTLADVMAQKHDAMLLELLANRLEVLASQALQRLDKDRIDLQLAAADLVQQLPQGPPLEWVATSQTAIAKVTNVSAVTFALHFAGEFDALQLVRRARIVLGRLATVADIPLRPFGLRIIHGYVAFCSSSHGLCSPR